MSSDVLPQVDATIPSGVPTGQDSLLASEAAALQQVRELLLGEHPRHAIQLAEELRQDLAATRREVRSELAALSDDLRTQVQLFTEKLRQETQSRRAAEENTSVTLQNTIELMSKSLGEVEGRVGTRIDTLEQRSVKAVRSLDSELHTRVHNLEVAMSEALEDLRANKVDTTALSGLFGAIQGHLKPGLETPAAQG